MADVRTPEDYVQNVLCLPQRGRVHLHRSSAAVGEHAGRLPVRRQVGLLPAVLGIDGAAAADGRHPGPRRHRVLDRRDGHQDRRVHRARLRRPFLGRGLLPRLGLDHVRPDARGLARAQPARRRRRPPRATAAAGPTSFGRDPLEDRGGGVPVVAEPAPWWRLPLFIAGGLAILGLLAVAARRWRRGAPPALSELERALRRTRREPAPGTTLHALEQRFAGRRPPPATSACCARAATATHPLTRRAHSAAACGPSSDAEAG